jgi:hypothetical protein
MVLPPLIPAPAVSAAMVLPPLPLAPAVSAATVLPPLIPAADPSAATAFPASGASAAAPPPLGLNPSAAVAAEVSGAGVSGPPVDLDPEEVIFNTYMLVQKISQQIDGIVSRDSSALQEYIGNKVFELDIKIDSLARMVAGVPAGNPMGISNPSLDTKIDSLVTMVSDIPTGTSTGYGEGQTGGKRRGTQKKRK